MRKIILLGILSFCLFLITGCSNKNTSPTLGASENNSSISFQDTKHGFSFEYPGNLNAVKSKDPNVNQKRCFGVSCLELLESADIKYYDQEKYSYGIPLPEKGDVIQVLYYKPPVITDENWDLEINKSLNGNTPKNLISTSTLTNVNNVQIKKINYSDGTDLYFYLKKYKAFVRIGIRTASTDSAVNSALIEKISSSIKHD